jgi:DNA-directed RNA polymerase sigma subunit (sigma70/sigma32)
MMCRTWMGSESCVNYRCPHNLFWESLKLNPAKVRITEKAREIRSCCCLIHERWTSEEIANAWGMTEQRVKQSEALAWSKVQGQNSCRQLKKVVVS